MTALALAWLAAGGCSNPFRPSEPAPPAGSVGVSAVNIDYTTADLTLETIKEAIEAKGQLNGLAAYTGALLPVTANAPGFTCVFDPQVVADRQLQGHQIPTWTPELELQTFYRYLSQLNTENYVMTWSTYQDAPLDNIDLVAGTAILYRAYQLTAVSQDNVAELLSIGRADLFFVRVQPNQWQLQTWTDHLDPSTTADPAEAGSRSFGRLRIDSTGK